jgi:hypothetical protein
MVAADTGEAALSHALYSPPFLNLLLSDLEAFKIDVTAYYSDAEPQGFYDNVLTGKLGALAYFCNTLGWSDPSLHRCSSGTCYLGFDVKAAIAETLLHDEIPKNGRFKLSYRYVESKYLVRFNGDKLTVAIMLGEQLKALGANGSISTILPYNLPQQWSVAIHKHPQKMDGILYVSRHLNDRNAVVIFDRANHKIAGPKYDQLVKAPDGIAAMKALKLDFPYA